MLKIKDLKKGEIYYGSWENGDKRCIFKQGVAAINSLDQFDNYSKEWCTSSIVTLRESTLGEKHWLNECIKANKFISYEEAMKTFKPQYIVNKWYKVKDWKFSYYVKFKSLEKVGYNKINGEIINAGTYKGDDYLANDQMEEKLELLEDLSEIQEFLPANHPDKVSNSLIGRYVKCLRDNANSCKVNDEWVRQAEYYQIGSIDGKYYKLKDGNYLGYIDRPDSQFKEKGFELMPVGFCPDNVIPEYVECIENYGLHKIGQIFKTEGEENGLTWKQCLINYENLNKSYIPSTKKAYEAQNKPTIKEKPMETNNEFKVGDWVVLIDVKQQGFNQSYLNIVFKIDEVKRNSNGQYVIGDLKSKDNAIKSISTSGVYSKNIRLAKLEEISTKDLSNEELLSIAKTYYPIGTKFEALYGHKSPLIVEENNHIFTKNTYCDVICVTTDKGNGSPPRNSAAIWSKEKGFAKIISSPNEIKGIKPSVKLSNFVLPEKWVVCPETEDNLVLIKQYFNKFEKYAISRIDNAYTSDGKYRTNVKDALKEGYTQITFNEFKNFVFQRQNNLTTIFEQTRIFPVEGVPRGERETSNEITIPKIVKMKSIVDFKLENSKLVNINVPIYTKPKKQVKSIKIEKFELSI